MQKCCKMTHGLGRSSPVTPSPVCGYATVHSEAAKAARAILAQVPGCLKRDSLFDLGREVQRRKGASLPASPSG